MIDIRDPDSFFNKNLEKIHALSKKLTETESELSAFFHLCPVLFTIADTYGYFCKVNEEWEKQFGWTAKELCSRPYIDFVHPDDLDKTVAAEKQIASGASLSDFRNRYRCKNGSYKTISWDASRYIDGKYTYTTSHVIEDPQ